MMTSRQSGTLFGWLGVHAALTEDPISIPSTYNSSFRGYDSLASMHLLHIQTCRQNPDIHKVKIIWGKKVRLPLGGKVS